MYVTISISTDATTLTTLCILLVDFFGNLCHCYEIMKLHKKVDFITSLHLKISQAEKEKKVKMLALSEALEIMIPLSYTITFIIAYYGPNATILRSVKNNYWSNTTVDNLGNVLATELMLFLVDFTSLVVGTTWLWCFCKINFLKEICRVLKTYWFVIAGFAGALVCKI